eukprot:scaffold61798_cov48-Attheya_sp.AAC.2
MVDAGSNKRKKFHDKDKYYRLAKEQGFRSRAAFKLSQINRKFRLLENAKIVIDLCAAPGGWTQVAARAMPRSGTTSSMIIAVDILPIRTIRGSGHVTTLIGDITTDTCKAKIRQEMQGAAADVVLCDGAPNVGASYDRDAYAQNEIALHCLKCATEHLKKEGSFVTKLYRSQDYSAYLWVAKSFFRTVQAVKPAASRSQSAEIFLICQGYLAPASIDPRMLDPRCVFEQVDGQATGGGDPNDTSTVINGKKFNVFHKNWNDKRRSRQGYDMDKVDFAMRNMGTTTEFIESTDKDPIHMLGNRTGLTFTCHLCTTNANVSQPDAPTCRCKFYLEHRLTTPEIKLCLSDLKVLNRSDFKGLLIWRTKMQEAGKERDTAESGLMDDADDDAMSVASDKGRGGREEDSEAEEDRIQAEIAELRNKKLREKKRIKKKEREVMAKRRRRAALGMDLNAIDVPDNEKIFSLASITSKGDLERAHEVDLSKITDDQLFAPGGNDDDEYSDEEGIGGDDSDDASQGEGDEVDEGTGYDYRLDRELDQAYDRFLTTTNNGMAKAGTKMAKRSKKMQRQKALQEEQEDHEMILSESKGIDADTKTYAKMLQGPRDSDDSSDEDDADKDSSDEDDADDGFHDEPVTPEEHASRVNTLPFLKKKAKNPLIHELPDDPSSVKTARWFSNPLFESIGTAALSATVSGAPQKTGKKMDAADDYDSESDAAMEDDVESLASEEEEPASKRRKKKNDTKKNGESGNGTTGLNADDVIASMPKTDKQVRHEKRLKVMERQERKAEKRSRLSKEESGDFEIAPNVDDFDDDDEDNITKKSDEILGNLSGEEKKRMLEARKLIKAGVGKVKDDKSGFEIVAAGPLPIMDRRKYDSENEDYDSDDYARTLALGTMMLRKSKAKALVDASYNRFAWNDPSDLPDWFVDDENKHHKPQLPIPAELVAKMKERVLQLSLKPIAKVAEARARKNKRAQTKLVAAKKKAESVANSSEMSEAMKLKAISKAMRGQDSKGSGKSYVVSKKNGSSQGSKGVQLVDKRMKSDKRSMARAEKKKKHGKKGGLTGSKKRRNHS